MNPQAGPLSESLRRTLRRKLLAWYDDHHRDLPWRTADNAYATWVSEVMLQQTRVEVVQDYFARWMDAFPSVQALAAASETDVLRLWQGLGYYSRAKRLLAGARYVTEHHQGRLPKSAIELQKVPGIGPYSAGAISSIAYGQPAPLVDGNVIRVLTRLFALEGDPGKRPLKARLWEIAGELVSRARPGDFNQALMELGALVCTPKSPSCVACPVRGECQGFSRGEVTRFPELPQRPAPTSLTMILVILRDRDRVALHKIPENARWWAGLDAFPFAMARASQSPLEVAEEIGNQHGHRVGAPRPLPVVKHTVTRYRIQLHPFEQSVRLLKNGPALLWVSKETALGLALPAPHKKALKGLFSS